MPKWSNYLKFGKIIYISQVKSLDRYSSLIFIAMKPQHLVDDIQVTVP